MSRLNYVDIYSFQTGCWNIHVFIIRALLRFLASVAYIGMFCAIKNRHNPVVVTCGRTDGRTGILTLNDERRGHKHTLFSIKETTFFVTSVKCVLLGCIFICVLFLLQF